MILENAKIYEIEEDLINQIFDVMVRDCSKYALELMNKPSSTEKQMEICLKMFRKPIADPAQYESVWEGQVYTLKDTYVMDP